jgi:hypothetical protein
MLLIKCYYFYVLQIFNVSVQQAVARVPVRSRDYVIYSE